MKCAQVSTEYVVTPGQRPYPVPGGGTGENEPFLDWLMTISALDDDRLPHVVSVRKLGVEQDAWRPLERNEAPCVSWLPDPCCFPGGSQIGSPPFSLIKHVHLHAG